MAKPKSKSYSDIQKQIADLQREAESARKREVADVVSRIRVAISTYGLTAQDLGLAGGAARRGRKPAADMGTPARKARGVRAGGVRKPATKGAVPVKYRDDQGNTWTGRGSQPRWLRAALDQGRRVEDFLI